MELDSDKESSSPLGFVYILTNPMMPGLLKIGKTTRSVKERAKEISSATGVPKPYIVEYWRITENVDADEKEVHKRLAHTNSGKEFFNLPIKEAIKVIEEVTKTKQLYFRLNETVVASNKICARCGNSGYSEQICPKCWD